MGANFPGSTNAVPGAYSEVYSLASGVTAPSGLIVTAIIGEGQRVERIVASALGAGADGFSPDFTSTTGSDGRHFKTTYYPLVANRSVLFKNGVPLVGVEQDFDSTSSAFNSVYDYRINTTNGQIELQPAVLVDQGGSTYSALSSNVGNGTISNLELLDPNAPSETWNIRCTSVRKDGYGNPMDGYGKFVAVGSISGNILDEHGNVVTWMSNGSTASNSILKFEITDGATPFNVGDRFTVKVKSGVLSKGDSLTATYIGELDLNSPSYMNSAQAVYSKHGTPSLSNRLSLGAQLAFANSAPGMFTCQAAPSVPRRVSYLLQKSASGGNSTDDLTFSLPLNVVPDYDSNVNLFIKDPVTKKEGQILPNKVDFYNSAITADPSLFTNGSYDYSYTVVMGKSVQKQGVNGVLVVDGVDTTKATLSSSTVSFGLDDLSVSRSIRILQSGTATGNECEAAVLSVANGVATIQRASGAFVSASSVKFEVLDEDATSAKVLLTKDLALTLGEGLRATVVDTKDADFFDPNWQAALKSLEKIECDIVVPLPSQTISSILQTAKNHCLKMSSIKSKKERVLFTGAIRGLEPKHVLGQENAAVEDLGVLEGIQGDDVDEILDGNTEDLTNYSVQDAFGETFRVSYFYPDEIIIPTSAGNIVADGLFMAPAVAGYRSALPKIQVPLTNKTIGGFTIPNTKLYDPEQIEALCAGGICLLQPVAGGGSIVWGKTTTKSGVATEEEMSIVFIRDRIAKATREIFSDFPGTEESDTTEGSLNVRLLGTVRSFVSNKWATDYDSLSVSRDLVEARQWNLSFRVQPPFPVNWLYFNIGIGLL